MRFWLVFIFLLNLSSFDAFCEWRYPNNARYAISLSFDDARNSQVDVGLPILDKHQVHGSFYLMPEQMLGYESAWKLAGQNGHEIANHSQSHLCTGNFRWLRKLNKGLEQVDVNFIRKDINAAQQDIIKLTAQEPIGFAYPCGQTFVGRGEKVKSYIPVVAKMFEYARTWNDETANDPLYYDPAQIRAFNMDGKTFSELKELLERAKFDNAWIVLAGHEVGEKGLYSIDSDALEQLIVYLKEPKNGFWLAPVGKVNQYIQKRLENSPQLN